MKHISLHPLSALVGCALAGLAVLLAGAAQVSGGAQSIPRDLRLVGQIPASWWVEIRLCTANPVLSYTVPNDRYLVLTLADGYTSILADGTALTLFPLGSYAGDRNGTRVVLPPGTVLTTNNGCGVAAWGYLEPVR